MNILHVQPIGGQSTPFEPVIGDEPIRQPLLQDDWDDDDFEFDDEKWEEDWEDEDFELDAADLEEEDWDDDDFTLDDDELWE